MNNPRGMCVHSILSLLVESKFHLEPRDVEMLRSIDYIKD